ncbi:hypothetical protein L0222_31640 [bacterium]|nr:hypothetical protein [bacterium]MCI0606557.1 hypothetical protein [bacterium]
MDPRRRAVELLTKSDLSAQEAAEVLADLCDAWVLHDLFWKKDHPRNHVVMEIGEKLNELGGFALMREAYERFVRLRPPKGSTSPGSILEQVWHGIGDWQR